MATYTTRERVFRTKEWIIPAAEPWGATHDQVLQCINLARSEVIARHQLVRDVPDTKLVEIFDDEVCIHVRDGEIVVVIVLEDRTA